MTHLEFRGTERFEVLGCLGSGAFGEVYRVHDRKLHTVVALKTLYRADPDAHFRFKKEFRALADVHHPNLVQLYELGSQEGQWFFTMELVDGVDFTAYARRNATGGNRGLAAESDHHRLRQGFRQLAEGLSALHDAGKLHRDIKPSNLRVTPEGRVVMLDFGLVKELRSTETAETLADGVLGSPVYMAPEQAAGEVLTTASDWYAAGAVLYEALLGRPPFAGRALGILLDKQQRRPIPPLAVDPTLPPDLGELCRDLLARDPRRRPEKAEVLRRLGEAPATRRGGSGQPGSAATSSTADEMPFVGRRRELATLSAASRRQGPVIALVHGSSGIGKTCLIRHFVAELLSGSDEPGSDEPLVLRGRCYERESVPYKALDALVDALCLYLAHLPGDRAEALLPADILALARLFPALRQVGPVARAGRQVLEIPGEQEQRRRARAALRQLLRRLTADRPTVLVIDDLQWGDQESADLLAELFRPPDPAPLLLVLSFRREERAASVFLTELLDSAFVRENAEIVDVPVDDLDDDDAAYDEIETYHDRIREHVASSLDRAAAAEIHRRLAVALELTGRADPETLAAHSRQAGDRRREARYVVAAAERASEALAFDRAARLYRTALDLGIGDGEERRRLWVELGDALANAGRGAEAAAAYLEAVDARPGDSRETVELLRRAAEQRLISGYVDEGLATLDRVLAAVGMTMPRSRTACLWSIVRGRIRMWRRGLDFEAREAGAAEMQVLAGWSREGFHLQHYLHLIGRVELALYRGDAGAAWAALRDTWPALVRSQLLRIGELARTEALFLRCRGALAAVAAAADRGSPPNRRVSKVLRRTVRRLERQQHRWAKPFSRLIRAGMASTGRRRDEAIDQLATVAREFDVLRMGLHAAVSRWRRGQLLGGGRGRRLVAEAERWMRDETVEDVERMADTLAPGSWQPPRAPG